MQDIPDEGAWVNVIRAPASSHHLPLSEKKGSLKNSNDISSDFKNKKGWMIKSQPQSLQKYRSMQLDLLHASSVKDI